MNKQDLLKEVKAYIDKRFEEEKKFPQVGDTYYSMYTNDYDQWEYVEGGSSSQSPTYISNNKWTNSCIDKYNLFKKNVFESEENVKRYYAVEETLMKYQEKYPVDWNDFEQEKRSFFYDLKLNRIVTITSYDRVANNYYFNCIIEQTSEIKQEIGEDNLIYFYRHNAGLEF